MPNSVFIVGILLSLASAFMQNKTEIVKTDNLANVYSKTYIIIAAILAICSLGANFLVIRKPFAIMTVGICFFAIFIAFCASKSGYKYSHLKLLCLLASIIFPIAMELDNNKALYRHSNSVENTLTSVFAIAFLLYISYEGNRLFTGNHSRWHFASMLLLTHTGFTLSLAYIFAYFTFNVNEKIRFYEMILVFIISVFVEIELIRFRKNAISLTQAEWDEIDALYEADQEYEPYREDNSADTTEEIETK